MINQAEHGICVRSHFVMMSLVDLVVHTIPSVPITLVSTRSSSRGTVQTTEELLPPACPVVDRQTINSVT